MTGLELLNTLSRLPPEDLNKEVIVLTETNGYKTHSFFACPVVDERRHVLVIQTKFEHDYIHITRNFNS